MTIEQTLANAISLHQSGRLDDAEAIYRQILAQDRQQATALHFLGLIAFQRGRIKVAAELVEQSVAACATEALPWRNLATIYKSDARLPDALAAAEKALQIAPEFLEAAIARAEILTDLGRLDDSLDAYRALLVKHPDAVLLHQRLADVFQRQDHPESALAHLGHLARLQPADPQWPAAIAALHAAANQLDLAAASYQRALDISPGNPDYLRPLAALQLRQSHLAAAQQTLQQLVVCAPDDVAALETLGSLLERRGDYGEAMSTYSLALQSHPDHAPTHQRLAHLLLRTGELTRGWEELAWPYLHGQAALPEAAAKAPLWDGKVLFSKKIFLHSAPTSADLILLLRYAALVKELGGHVILECPRSFDRLLVNLTAIDECVDPGDGPAQIDYHCPLALLPGLLGATLDNLPSAAGYLHADPALAAAWAPRLAPPAPQSDTSDAPPPLHIGVVWRADASPGPFESFAREILASLLKTPNTRFFSLQRGDAGGIVAPPAGLDLIDLTTDIHDFADLAALLDNLHMVIGLDATPAHLAAALGIPTWILLPRHAHWCWLTERPDSPWYRAVRLFRGGRRG